MHYCSVKRSITPKALLTIVSIVVITLALAFFVLPGFFLPILLVGGVLTAAVAPGILFTEYEYSIEGSEFSVAIIRNKSNRKELFACDMAFLLSCGPLSGKKREGIVIDARAKSNSEYLAAFSEDGKMVSVLFSPTEEFVKELWYIAPSKVTRNIM